MPRRGNKARYLGRRSTQELINLTKSALMRKQNQMQFGIMPDPALLLGKVAQYVGATTARFTKGHLYRSTGTTWQEVYPGAGGEGGWSVSGALPPYDEAEFGNIYFVEDEEGSYHGWVKGDDGGFIEVTGSPATISDEEILELMSDEEGLNVQHD